MAGKPVLLHIPQTGPSRAIFSRGTKTDNYDSRHKLDEDQKKIRKSD